MVGDMLRNVLNATYNRVSFSAWSASLWVGVTQMRRGKGEGRPLTFEMTSAVSVKVGHLPKPDRARKSSIRRVPML